MDTIQFSYKALDKSGQPIAGTVQAPSREAALLKIQELREQGFNDIAILNAAVASESVTKKCPSCAETVQAEALKCKHCGQILDEKHHQKKHQAEKKIQSYLSQGFLIQFRDEYRVQLVKKKRFSKLFALLWLIFGFGFGIVIYLLYYLVKTDKIVNIKLT